jgi:hypothetical protein
MATPIPEEEFRARLELIWKALEMFGPATSWPSKDPYFVHAWNQSNMPLDEAERLAQEPLTIFLALTLSDHFGLPAILADRFASAGLRKCLVENHLSVRKALQRYVVPPKPKGKRGPTAFRDGKSKEKIAMELRAQGWTLPQIAQDIYGNPKKVRQVRALLQQAAKKFGPLESALVEQ